jgi:hypothetical protein
MRLLSQVRTIASHDGFANLTLSKTNVRRAFLRASSTLSEAER